MSKFKVGDRVKIKKKAFHSGGSEDKLERIANED